MAVALAGCRTRRRLPVRVAFISTRELSVWVCLAAAPAGRRGRRRQFVRHTIVQANMDLAGSRAFRYMITRNKWGLSKDVGSALLRFDNLGC